MLSKSVNNKKCAPKLVFFNEKKNEKDSDDFGHRKFTLKVQFSHFGPSWQSYAKHPRTLIVPDYGQFCKPF